MRTIVALLILANLAFFGWSRGWLSPWLVAAPAGDAGQREPQRLQQQIRPETIVIVGKSPAPREPTTQCLQTIAFDAASIDRAEAALRSAAIPNLDWQRLSEPADQAYLRLPRVGVVERSALAALDDSALRSLQLCPP